MWVDAAVYQTPEGEVMLYYEGQDFGYDMSDDEWGARHFTSWKAVTTRKSHVLWSVSEEDTRRSSDGDSATEAS